MFKPHPDDETGPSVVKVSRRVGSTNSTVMTEVMPFYNLSLRPRTGTVKSGGSDTEEITVEIKNGVELARGVPLGDASVVPVDETVTISVDGAKAKVDVTNGSGVLTYKTDKTAPSTTTIKALSVSSQPATPSSSKTIEVLQ